MRVETALEGGSDRGTKKNHRRVILLSVALFCTLVIMSSALVLLFLPASSSDCDTHLSAEAQRSSEQSSSSIDLGNSSQTVTPITAGFTLAPTPTPIPSFAPTLSVQPSLSPTSDASKLNPTYSDSPSDVPSQQPTLINATFTPGNLTITENNLILSQGLQSRVLAESGKRVLYVSGNTSTAAFHVLPDFGSTFSDPGNPDGWIYVSNSEVKDFDEFPQKGGVGALTFDSDGNVVDYHMILEGTKANCGGGSTPWGAWISCEEHGSGVNWQVDPTGQREPKIITLGSDDGGGAFESFASHGSRYFVTEDAEAGPLRRFSPNAPTNTSNGTDPWGILLGPGNTEYLMLYPDNSTSAGFYVWTTDKDLAKENSRTWYRHSEGIDIVGDTLFFVSKVQKEMFILDLVSNTYTVETTVHGLFDGSPDQVISIVGDDELLFFTEEGGSNAGGKHTVLRVRIVITIVR